MGGRHQRLKKAANGSSSYQTQTAAGLITDFNCYNITDHHVSIGSSKCCSYVHHISHPFSPSRHPARLAPPHAESHPSGDAEAQATVRIGPDQGAVVGRTSGGEVERGAGHSWLCQLFGGVLGRLGHYQPLRWYSFRPCNELSCFFASCKKTNWEASPVEVSGCRRLAMVKYWSLMVLSIADDSR